MTQVRVEGLDELARELKRIDPALTRVLAKANKTVSEKAVDLGRPRIQALPAPGGSIATRGLTARATPKQATIALLGSNRTIRASVFGAQTHWAWGHKKRGPGPWQPWLGQSWEPEDLYGLGPALVQTVDQFAVNEYADAYMQGMGKAFPDG